MIKVSQAAYNLLRNYCNLVASTFIQQWNQRNFVGALCPYYVSDRPDESLLSIISQGGTWTWEPQLIKADIPCPGWYSNFDSNPIYGELKNELIKCLPPATDEHSQSHLNSLADYDIDRYINITVRRYLAFLISFNGANAERALSLAANLLDVRLDPERSISYSGSYLYNFTLDESVTAPVKLAHDIKIRMTTFEDVVRQANFDEVEGKFLPPPYILTLRTDNPYSPLIAVSGLVLSNDNENFSVHNTVIAVLRLYQSNYVGRGSILCWTEGLGHSFGSFAATNDSNVLMFIRGDSPSHLPQWSEYKLESSSINEIKETLNLVRNLIPIDESVKRVIRLLGESEPDWASLYKVHEIIAADIGGINAIVSNGWLTRAKQSLFTQTANNPQAIGDQARHGHQTTQPPKIPMELSEAKELIANTVLEWLRLKKQTLRQSIELVKSSRNSSERQYLDFLAENHVHLNANSFRLPDRLILLVRYQQRYGALQALEQSFFNGTGYIRYKWWYQPDDLMDFIIGDPQYGFGYAWEGSPDNPPILKIGPVNLFWSAAGEGAGYVYFGPSSNPSDDYEMVMTNEDNISYINISDYINQFVKSGSGNS